MKKLKAILTACAAFTCTVFVLANEVDRIKLQGGFAKLFQAPENQSDPAETQAIKDAIASVKDVKEVTVTREQVKEALMEFLKPASCEDRTLQPLNDAQARNSIIALLAFIHDGYEELLKEKKVVDLYDPEALLELITKTCAK